MRNLYATADHQVLRVSGLVGNPSLFPAERHGGANGRALGKLVIVARVQPVKLGRVQDVQAVRMLFTQ